uniref:Uncharacterized protein n=1 Tax=Trichobilharzia regenti TaxID=157069 RepID=A0AA85KKD2_TRIRE|nr:unnamed protein product [Trichobilharzia regenti]
MIGQLQKKKKRRRKLTIFKHSWLIGHRSSNTPNQKKKRLKKDICIFTGGCTEKFEQSNFIILLTNRINPFL